MVPPIIRGSEFGSGIFWRNDPLVVSEFGGGGLSAINFSVSSTRSLYPSSSYDVFRIWSALWFWFEFGIFSRT